ncbi:hypothetical protein [Spirosoma sordidisoli]|uniref:Uncharacterized protein n=1 Tax=Spirosoma sordidisoli TaxID=2502893 RepID=A0A4Q2UBE6_9BACT|nr:hypothetical protein [Spirosoma sordidisoli]RYC66353.1 hypothetical protein EQG79_30230 [Spirosoma sordidisoli]
MTLAEQYANIDRNFPDGPAGSIGSAQLRTQLKLMAQQLRQDATTITGWSPVLRFAQNGTRVVAQVVDWTNGQGAKPATGAYLGQDGFTNDLNAATDLRGPQGIQGLPGSGFLSYVSAPNDGGAAVRYLPVAILPASTGASYDVARFTFIIGAFASTRQTIELQCGNRDGFVYRWASTGPDTALEGTSVEAYRDGGGAVTVYVKLTNQFKTILTHVTQHLGLTTVFSALTPIAGSPAGTKVFDSALHNTYPPMFFLDSGRFGINGFPQEMALDVADRQNKGVVAEFRNNTNAGNGARVRFHQGGVAIWRIGVPGGQRNEFVIDGWGGGSHPEHVRISDNGQVNLAGRLAVRGLIAMGNTPTLTAGPGLGPGPTISLWTESKDTSGVITLRCNGSPQANAVLATLTFAYSNERAPVVTLTPASPYAAANLNRVWVESSTVNFNIRSGITGVDTGVDLVFHYHATL